MPLPVLNFMGISWGGPDMPSQVSQAARQPVPSENSLASQQAVQRRYQPAWRNHTDC